MFFNRFDKDGSGVLKGIEMEGLCGVLAMIADDARMGDATDEGPLLRSAPSNRSEYVSCCSVVG